MILNLRPWPIKTAGKTSNNHQNATITCRMSRPNCPQKPHEMWALQLWIAKGDIMKWEPKRVRWRRSCAVFQLLLFKISWRSAADSQPNPLIYIDVIWHNCLDRNPRIESWRVFSLAPRLSFRSVLFEKQFSAAASLPYWPLRWRLGFLKIRKSASQSFPT